MNKAREDYKLMFEEETREEEITPDEERFNQLVVYLRKEVRLSREEYQGCILYAANRLEELQKRVDELTAALNLANAETEKSNKLVDELRHERNVLQKICSERSDELLKLEQQIPKWVSVVNIAGPCYPRESVTYKSRYHVS